jgi:hypothetical protein
VLIPFTVIRPVQNGKLTTHQSHLGVRPEQDDGVEAHANILNNLLENDSLVGQIDILSKGVASGNGELIRDIQRFMDNWWTKH